MQIKGSFQITDWQESTEQTFKDGSKRTKASVTQTYSGEMNGTSQVNYQMYYDKQGNAEFNGFEYIELEQNGGSSMLVLKHNGKFEGGLASSNFVVISSSTDECPVHSKGRFVSTQGGNADYQIG